MALLDIVTPCWLKRRYLVGIRTTDDEDEPYPEDHYTHAIAWGIAQVEADLGIVVRDRLNITDERHDTYDNDASHYYTLALDRRPVREVTKITVKYGSDSMAELPKDWGVVRGETGGQVQLIPGRTPFSSVVFYSGGVWWVTAPHRRYAPAWLVFDYVAGIDWDNPAEHDELLLAAIGLYAAQPLLDTAGDLILGAGIATMSTSFDGVSTSIGSTSSATNAGYGAKLLSYIKRLDKHVMPALRARYQSHGFFAV